ncbi:SPOC like C-terminal domain-containing protein [Leucosporidium creatinivorum]|uniref:ATP-dependent DNA helicase II subunit 1 n=1 Tax=Leucosporidium creatinivorum TaxID=106004 RepID=A0A1Y2FZJ2_9BASI|nr:SPOC like C-terminal domain-containing protein [Leucosporidium creatinivorum]
MNEFDGWKPGYQEDEEEDLADYYQHTTEAFLFMIEATPTMLDISQRDSLKSAPGAPSQSSQLGWKGKDAQSKMELALRAALAVMKRKVISNPKDLVGIIIFNTKESEKGSSQGKHCQIVLDLQKITATSIRDLKTKLEEVEDDPKSIYDMFAPNEEDDNVLPSALGLAVNKFSENAPNKRMSKRLMLITDNDDPFNGMMSYAEPARRKINDLRDGQYELQHIFIPPKPNTLFDLDKLYGELLTGDDEDAPWPETPTSLNATLIAFVTALRAKEATKRSAFKIPFTLGDKLTIGVSGYNLVGEEKKRAASKVNLDSREGRDVVMTTVAKDVDGKDPIPKELIKKCFQVGKADPKNGTKPTQVFFDDNELKKIKALGLSTGLTLLGFKPRSREFPSFGETVKHAHFIVPNEESHSGSTRTFAALWSSMLKKKVVGYGVLVSRSNSKPQVVLLIPQEEELIDGVRISSAGIHLCQLPYADDVREHGLTSSLSIIEPPTEEDPDRAQPAVEVAKTIVKHLMNPYNPDNFPNPALNYHYEAMAAIALDEDVPDPVDKTVPLYNIIHKKAGEHLMELKALIDQDEVDNIPTSNKTNNKRSHSQPPEIQGDLSGFITELKSKGKKVTVEALKQACRAMGEKVSGKKDELYERVIEGLKRRGKWDADGDESEEDVKPKKKTKRVVDSDDDE